MPNLFIGDLVEVAFKYSSNADATSRFINRVHFTILDPGIGGFITEADLADGLSDPWSNCVRPLMSSAGKYEGCVVQSWPGGIRSAGSISAAGAGVGARSADMAPPAVAVVIRKRTASAGRKFRGRIFIPCLSNADVLSGALSVAYKAVVNAGSLIADMGFSFALTGPGAGATLSMVVCKENGAAIPTVNGTVTSGDVDGFARSQRRRQVGRGS